MTGRRRMLAGTVLAAALTGCTPATPAPALPTPDAPVEPTSRVTVPAGQLVIYPDCAAVVRSSAAPLASGQPGYRLGLDGDGDGWACENGD